MNTAQQTPSAKFLPTISSTIALSIQRKYGITDPKRMYRAAEVFQKGLTPLPSGSFRVVSLSRPNQTHNVNPIYEDCTCESATRGEMCIHLISWRMLVESREQARNLIINAFAIPKSILVKPKRDLIAEREAEVKLERARVRQTEWYEELDLV